MSHTYQELEDRTFQFALDIKKYAESLPYSLTKKEHGKQLVRSSGSVAANYVEANEALSKNDFYYRIKICRKEAKESELWLKLIVDDDPIRDRLVNEADQLKRIFSSINNKRK